MTYPYIQPYANKYELLPRADPNNKNAFTDQFFKPKKVNNFWNQIDKYWNVLFWWFTPLPYFVWTSNVFWWAWDSVTITDPDLVGTYPNMYRNWFAASFMA